MAEHWTDTWSPSQPHSLEELPASFSSLGEDPDGTSLREGSHLGTGAPPGVNPPVPPGHPNLGLDENSRGALQESTSSREPQSQLRPPLTPRSHPLEGAEGSHRNGASRENHGEERWSSPPESPKISDFRIISEPLEGDPGEEWFSSPIAPSAEVAGFLTGEQWLAALREGILSGPDGKIHLFDADKISPPSWSDIRVHIDVPLCLSEGIKIFHGLDGEYYTHGSTLRGILLPRYFRKVDDLVSGVTIYPELPLNHGDRGVEVNEESIENQMSPLNNLDAPEPREVPDRPLFRFQADLPLEERASFQRNLARRVPLAPNLTPYSEAREDGGEQSFINVLDEDWSQDYEGSACWVATWRATQNPEGTWPPGIKVWQNKMYWAERLCVPEGVCAQVVTAFHQYWGHIGIDKMISEILRRCEFPTGISVGDTVKRVKATCQVCQMTEPPNWKVAQQIEMTPVPSKIFTSVCLDVFSMQPENGQGVEYDCIFLCVDRLSGWITAKPTQKLGLTAEKAAHLVLDDGGDIYGIPTIVTSDQGPQLTGIWWKTLCNRLGI